MRAVSVALVAISIWAAAGGSGSAAAAAYCSGPPAVTYVTFAPGSAQLPEGVLNAHLKKVGPRMYPGTTMVSQQVLAMGDIAEGEAWERASAEERKADRALAEARGAALRAMLAQVRRRYRAERITVDVRENRQLFTPEQLAQEPELSDGLRAIVRTWFRVLTAEGLIVAC